MNEPPISPPLAAALAPALALSLALISAPISAEIKDRSWDSYACELMPQRFQEAALRVIFYRFIRGDRSMVIHCVYIRSGYYIRPLMYQDTTAGDRLMAFELRGVVYLALRPHWRQLRPRYWFYLL